uniref:Uncharacterized protein n=1 Tax=Anguilla anguilla TaxID=7936 RepID=A0A0E9V8J8_ANGAN
MPGFCPKYLGTHWS